MEVTADCGTLIKDKFLDFYFDSMKKKMRSIYFISKRPIYTINLLQNSKECLMNTAITKCMISRLLYQTQTKQKTSTIMGKPSSIKTNEERLSSLSLKESAKNFNNRLKRGDVMIYRAPQDANKFFWWWHIAAFLQFIFWANLAELSWQFQQKKKKAQNSSISISFLDKYKQAIYVASYLFAGFGIGAIMFAIPARSVLAMSILKNGNIAKIITGRKYRWGKEKKIPVKKLYTNQPIWNEKGESGSGQILNAIFLRNENERMAYMLDGLGKFEDPKIFDLLFYKNKNGKKGK